LPLNDEVLKLVFDLTYGFDRTFDFAERTGFITITFLLGHAVLIQFGDIFQFYYNKVGLWTASEVKNRWHIKQEKLSDGQYAEALKNIAKLDQNGMTEQERPQAYFVVVEQNACRQRLHIAVRFGTADTAADTVVTLIDCLVGKVTAEVVVFTFSQLHIRQARITCFFGNNADSDMKTLVASILFYYNKVGLWTASEVKVL
jgi:hypothetical protein